MSADDRPRSHRRRVPRKSSDTVISYPPVRPYHVNVPSFGEWGFVLAALDRIPKEPIRAIRGRFISPEVDPTLFVFSADLKSKQAVEATTLTRPRVVEYFSTDWRRWN